jgi:hypothetical protein
MTAKERTGRLRPTAGSLDVCFTLKDGDIWWRRHATTNTIKPQHCATEAWDSSNRSTVLPTYLSSCTQVAARAEHD